MKRVALVTAILAGVVSVLTVLFFLALAEMQDEANEVDDARATHAASAAIRSFKSRLGSTVRDNAVWDDAYTEIGSPKGAAWAYENWGKTSADYPLYDAAVVLTPNQQVLSAYKKGEEFAPLSYFSDRILSLAHDANAAGQKPVTAFIRTEDGVYLVGAGTIQPYKETAAPGHASTLIFAKLLTPDVVRQIDETFDIIGLRLVAVPSKELLNVPLVGQDGRAIGYFEWPSRQPGAVIYQAAKGYLIAAAVVVVLFFAAIIVMAATTVRSLQRHALSSHYKAHHDALTGLLNRAGLLETIEAKPPGFSTELSLGMIDLDGFKDVNDAWGHAIGDELIRLVGGRLQAEAGTALAVARLGGDEFAFLAPADRAEALATNLVQALEQPFRIDGRTIEIGASIGTCWLEEGVHGGFELLRRADMALYRAKETGRGRVVAYSKELDRDREQRTEMEDQLRTAIVAREVRPVFQPLVDAVTGKLRGVEALARWTAKTGPVSPEAFITAAERAGLIDELGRAILEMAIEDAKDWDGIGLSVNVSPLQLKNPDFAGAVEEILRSTAFDPNRLTLEITEGVLMSNPEQAKRTIDQLRSIGVKFALDDFGSGYASIGTLRQFGFDRMKIDRSLVMSVGDERGTGVLKATLSLARALDIPVTAEGVETQEQADALAEFGCDLLQGYLFGRPMGPQQLRNFILETSRRTSTDISV
jgi:diguanylate cyclase (GGDEF)-like protein